MKIAAACAGPRKKKIGDKSHRAILRLQGLNALGNVAIIDVGAVDVHKVVQGGRLVTGRFVGGCQFIVERDARFAIDAGTFKLCRTANRGSGTPFSRKHWASQVCRM